MEFQLDQASLQAVFDVPDNEGQFPPSLRAHLEALGKRRPCVFLAFPPKAAGTFLRQAIIMAIGGDLIRVVHAQGGRDAQPYLPTLLGYFSGGITSRPMVTHVHMQALRANIHFIEAFGLRPIVMIRNIPDMLASYWDMLDADPDAMRQGLNCRIPVAWHDYDEAQKADFLVDIMGPWYASFYATWFDYAGQPQSKVCLLRYADFLADPAHALETVLHHSGIEKTLSDCEDVIDLVTKDRERLRFNQGKEGRAATYFNADHQRRLGRILSHYAPTRSRLGELLGH
jgi:hypothetical protein